MNRQDLVVKPEVKYFSSLEALSQEAARHFCQRVREGVADKGIFTLVLSGGSTPRRLYEILSQPPLLRELPWPRIHFFWGDERYVPSDHRDSNFAMAHASLLSRIPVPETNVHPVEISEQSGPETAFDYEEKIRVFFQAPNPLETPLSPEQNISPPSFDLVLLGLGQDGHTASLFPGDSALEEKRHWTAWVPRPGQPPDHPRITLTLPIINQADEVLFLVSGEGKKEIVQTTLEDPMKAQSLYPAARVKPRGRLSWFVA
jgi:6-phosphogluconolactonase